uniref:ATP synthase complex subunit 8 n=1 Tax=Athetis lepigone TaxID=1223490 RepID=A0A343K914_ATHLE|nr:ATP synthase F0 subunit 8 [Athetis lepigone]ATE89009.1 ATP synthase F0 subunit 8 [Athetis lepigone]ATE89022.1 ATP synthase F0 subunit 8 [Athetis lepigone]ATE89035.1 ATP synthase F0 subunit 8 [Athetis lepigone]ATE89048.1 ATP synthase F0 subunit 8 [Athetis lepigone]ATE89061.1 ATP synthase F0 subunit 8 [Athetis lepigone]
MPQMMPINWMISFLFFLLVYLIFNIMNYYIFNKKKLNKNNNFSIKLKNFNWKW